jgi:vacuolar-type H+-ATPase subunit I/STV1
MDTASHALQQGDILFKGAEGLLQFGPIGLAALMLVLTIMAILFRDIKENHERLLTQFMYVGAVCFAMSIVTAFWSSSHVVHFRVFPNESAAFKNMPRPDISVDADHLTSPFSYRFWSDKTAIIDMSESINTAQMLRQRLEQAVQQTDLQRSALVQLANDLEGLQTLIQQPVQEVEKCPKSGLEQQLCIIAVEPRAVQARLAQIGSSLGVAKATIASGLTFEPMK